MAQDACVKDIQALRSFGQKLQQMGEQMYQEMLQAQRRMQIEHANNWRDDQTDRFETRFNESLQLIKRMSEQYAAYNQYVTKICNIQEEYARLRINLS